MRKLQDGLAAVEAFPVQYSQLSPSAGSLRFLGLGEGYAAARAAAADAGSLSAGLAALAQPFKLRLSRAPHERQLRDYSSNVVLIEPLATMAAVEDFLWPRVYRSEAPAAAAAKPAAEGAEGRDAPAAGTGAAAGSGAAEPIPKAGGAEAQPPSAQGQSPRGQPPAPAEGAAAGGARVTRAQAARAASAGGDAQAMEMDERRAAPASRAAPGADKPAAPELSEEDNDIIMLQVG